MTRNASRHGSRVGKRSVVHLEVLVEEESAVEALRPILSRLFQGQNVRIGIRQFRGKPDLLKKLPDRLRGYAASRRRGDNVRVVVLVDRDNDDCVTLKKHLDSLAQAAGLIPRSKRGSDSSFHVLNRIAVRELESWYFGDWDAVRAAFPKVPRDVPRIYRTNPDQAPGKCSDAFERVLRASGTQIASKPEWGRRIGKFMNLEKNRSASFMAFIAGVREIAADETP